VALQVRGNLARPERGVSKAAYHQVARPTQEPSDFPRHMIVINVRRLAWLKRISTCGTASALALQHVVVGVFRYAVSMNLRLQILLLLIFRPVGDANLFL
jgi:hypothetical protein